jgi:hypothetical protein
MGFMRGVYLNNVMTFKDSIMSPAQGTTPWEGYPALAVENDPGTGFTVFDDFISLSNQATNGLWLVTKGTGGSIALQSSAPSVGGWIAIPTAASASNDYQVFSTQQKVFNFFTGLDGCFEAMVQLTEANTNTASWYVGLTSTVTTGFLQNSGAPASSYSGVVFWKANGALVIKCQTSNGSTQHSSPTLATATSGTTFIVGATINHNDNTTAKVTPYVCKVASNVRTLVTVGATLDLPLASLAAMYFSFGVRTGSTSAETLLVDYVQASQGRYYQ